LDALFDGDLPSSALWSDIGIHVYQLHNPWAMLNQQILLMPRYTTEDSTGSNSLAKSELFCLLSLK
jgi:hypothetical protein